MPLRFYWWYAILMSSGGGDASHPQLLKAMITFTSQSTFHSVTSNGITLGKLYVTREAAEKAAAALNREWQGQRTFGVKSWQQEVFTAHQA